MADCETKDGRFSFNDKNTSRFSEKNEISIAVGASLAPVIPDEMNVADDSEREGLLHETFEEKSTVRNVETPMKVAIIWMVVNTLATIGIVSLTQRISRALDNHLLTIKQ